MAQTGWVGVLGRAGRRTNVALLTLLCAAFASGGLAFGVGTVPGARLVAVMHGSLGLGLLLLVPWKSVIIRRGRAQGAPARGRRAGVVLGLLLVLSLCAGVLHAVSGYRGVAGVSALAVHVGAAAIALPFLLIHVLRRRQRMRRSDLSRRTLLRAGALGVGSLAAYATLAASTSLLALPGRQRRPTGSYEIGSNAPGVMPVTQWFTDTVPVLSTASWEVSLNLHPIPYSDVAAGRDTVRAVLDCTGGWYAEQEWRGVALSRLLRQVPAGTRSIDVISSTGYRRRLPMADLDHLLLATHVAGQPLSEGHGGPVRLVAPGRRGFWWVKWVQRIEVTAEPWWLQPPFPLQ
jgi:Oxidoreductase molybdopterin binding domain